MQKVSPENIAHKFSGGLFRIPVGKNALIHSCILRSAACKKRDACKKTYTEASHSPDTENLRDAVERVYLEIRYLAKYSTDM